jgi:hypothetical protein
VLEFAGGTLAQGAGGRIRKDGDEVPVA